MRFENAYLAVLFVIVPILVLMFYWAYLRRKRLTDRFVDSVMWPQVMPSVSGVKRFWQWVMAVVAVVLMVLVMMRPQYGFRLEDVQQQGRDVLVLVDTSASMLARDISPSRFDRAKLEVLGLLENLKSDRVALGSFSGDTTIYIPFSSDYDAVRLFLQDLYVGDSAVPGTDLSLAIERSLKLFDRRQRQSKILIILSDGETFTSDPIPLAQQAKKEGVMVYTVGIGTANGDPIPDLRRDGQVAGVKRDASGQVILSKLNESMLRSVAEETGGKYFYSSESQVVADSLSRSVMGLEKGRLDHRVVRRYYDRFQWVLIWVFALLIVSFVLSERHRTERSQL